MEPSTSIEDLPDNVLVEILSYLELNDLILSARHVCSHWKEASEDVLLWRNHVYTPARRDSDVHISRMLQQSPKLRKLVLERGVRSVVLRTIVDHCPHLRNVTFYSNQMFYPTFLKNLAAMCPNIEFIHVPSHQSVEFIGQFSNLKEISFEDWPGRELVLKPIADGCPNLQKISLNRRTVSYDDFAYFIGKKKDQLESLDVNWRSLDYKCLIIPLTNCTKLKTLVISEYQDTDLDAGFNALSRLNSLTSLTLNCLGAVDVKYLINVFKKYHLQELEKLCMECYHSYEDRLSNIIFKNCPKLKKLNLSSTNLSDDSLTNIHLLQDLETVHFRYTKVGDDGVKSLTKCKKIKYLDLSGCERLSETGMTLMVEFTNLQFLNVQETSGKGLPFSLFSLRLPHLQHLNVNYCKDVDREALAHLKEEKPNLVVEDCEPYIYSDDDYDDGNPENVEQNNEDGQPALQGNLQADDGNVAVVDEPVMEEHIQGDQPMPDNQWQDPENNQEVVAQFIPELAADRDPEEDVLICIQNLFGTTPEDAVLPEELLPEGEPDEVHLVLEPNAGAFCLIEPVSQRDPDEEEFDVLICVQNLFEITLENAVLPEEFLPEDEPDEVHLVPEPNAGTFCLIEPVLQGDSEEDEEINILISVRNLFGITPEEIDLPQESLLRNESSDVAAVRVVPDSDAGVICVIEHVPNRDPEDYEEIDLLTCVQNLFRIFVEKTVLFEETLCIIEVEAAQPVLDAHSMGDEFYQALCQTDQSEPQIIETASRTTPRER